MVLFRSFAGVATGVALHAYYSVKPAACDSAKVSFDDLVDKLPPVEGSDVEWGIPWNENWDSRSPQTGKVARQVIFIRHGQYQNEKASVSDSQRNLTPLGEQQSIETGKYLAKIFSASGSCSAIEGTVSHPKYMYVSNMTRAKQTIDLITDSFPEWKKRLIVDKNLRERFPCNTEPPNGKKRCDKSDSIAVETAFHKYLHRPPSNESTCDVVVCHANIIRYFLCRALQVPPEAWLRFSLPHCSLTSISITGKGHVKVNYVGSAFHLEPAMQTTRNLP
eukprot:Tbor_TRINITY_DN6583_c0_g1::TRINITY_DN6583_c0_g1_i1::g.7411::m.7411/K15637/PGAM5; serine/threonine-protein phosphatase PGAM5